MKRTIKQNNSLHKYCTQLAAALDAGGFDMREVIKVPIKPTKENVKEEMIKPVMRKLYPGITSTTQLSTTQAIELYDVVDRATGQSLGIHVPWPCEETMRARR
ncbi:MAG: hypothetical protein GY938_15020 [Ketobacter sp.]|nr:hypothetical protein [Ketobacter sp.]